MEDGEAPSVKLPDKLGLLPNRACRPCVRIKAKCVPLENFGSSVCQRCHRLGKECTTPVPRKRALNSPNNSTRITQMAKPESTADHIPAAHEQPPVNRLLLASWQVPDDATSTSQKEPANLNVQEYFPKGRTDSAGTIFDISPEIGHIFVRPLHESLFEQYRTHMSRYFPFIVIPSTTTTLTMVKERPFLYTCCVTAAAHRDPPLQARIARDVLKYVSEHMLLSGEKSLDLLQGLLVMTAWYHVVYSHNNPQLMNLLHLAKALVVDLGINRPLGPPTFQIKLSPDAQKMIHGTDPEDAKKHNLEERRTLLAIYHAHWQYAATFRRLDPPTWTEHMGECCTSLQEAAEYCSDAYTLALVQLDHLLERYIGAGGLRPGKSMPIQTYVRLFSEDLDRFKRSLNTKLQMNELLLAEIQAVELCLFEPIISASTDVAAHKVEAYYSCLRCIASYIDKFTARPVEDIPHIPFKSWVSIAHAFDILAKLSFVQTEGWDLEYARNTPGFMALADKVIAKLREVYLHEERQFPTSRTVRFKMFVERVETFKQWYLARLQAEPKVNQQTFNEKDNHSRLPDDGLPAPVTTDFSDLIWQDFMADWPRLDSDFMNSTI